jgi:phosphatidylinositol alpha 1,6-mannosyltransferase
LAAEQLDPLPLDAVCRSVQRVALFTEAFLPKVDGVSRTALLTIKHLENTGREVIVFAPAPAPFRVSKTPIYPIPSLWLAQHPETRVAPPWIPALLRTRQFKPDLIHLFSPFSLGSIGMVAGGMLRVPVVANYMTDLPGYTRSYGIEFARGLFIYLLRYLHNGCTLNLAPTQATLDEIRAWGFRRLRVWGRGVDSRRFSPSKRSVTVRTTLLARRDPSRLLVLYVGRISREKHLESLREVAAEPGVALTLIGGGESVPEIKRAFAHTDAHFIDYMYGDTLSDAYASADVFVFPGPEETFGQVVLEAMASGLPAIVTDRGGPQSLVVEGQTGFIVPTDDSAAFADRVRRLRDDPNLRHAMGAAARHEAQKRPWYAIMQQLECYYDEALRLYKRLHHG